MNEKVEWEFLAIDLRTKIWRPLEEAVARLDDAMSSGLSRWESIPEELFERMIEESALKKMTKAAIITRFLDFQTEVRDGWSADVEALKEGAIEEFEDLRNACLRASEEADFYMNDYRKRIDGGKYG